MIRNIGLLDDIFTIRSLSLASYHRHWNLCQHKLSFKCSISSHTVFVFSSVDVNLLYHWNRSISSFPAVTMAFLHRTAGAIEQSEVCIFPKLYLTAGQRRRKKNVFHLSFILFMFDEMQNSIEIIVQIDLFNWSLFFSLHFNQS